jgi:hypothetical protein
MTKAKLPLLVLVVLIVPACGSNISVPAPLMTDTFSSPFPDSNWAAAVTTGSGTAPVTAGGALAFTATAQPSSSTTTTAASFTNPSVTFSVQMAAKTTSEPGVGTIEILDGTNAVVAFFSWDVGAGTDVYSIAGTPLASPPAPPASDGTFTTFVFSVNASGTATWSHNNVGVATNTLPAGPLRLRLGATWATGSSPFAEFDFSNVSVSSP